MTDLEQNPVPAGSIGSFEVSFSNVVDGDFDNDGDLDCNDIDALNSAIILGTNHPTYDVTGDNLVNQDDLNEWVLNLKGTLFGDANLDFDVDTSDFNIWNSNKFQSGRNWCTGDFNADGNTDISDFNIFNSNKFQSARLVAPFDFRRVGATAARPATQPGTNGIELLQPANALSDTDSPAASATGSGQRRLQLDRVGLAGRDRAGLAGRDRAGLAGRDRADSRETLKQSDWQDVIDSIFVELDDVLR